MAIDYLNLGLRFLHLFAAFTAVGGLIFIRFALLPSMNELGAAEREDVHSRVRPRWAKLVGIAIGFLLLSGLANYILFVRTFKTMDTAWTDVYAMPYHMLFGIKFAVALVMFFFASALAVKPLAYKRFATTPVSGSTSICFWRSCWLSSAALCGKSTSLQRLQADMN